MIKISLSLKEERIGEELVMRFSLDSDTAETGSTELEKKMADGVKEVLMSFVRMVDSEANRQKNKKSIKSFLAGFLKPDC